MDRLLKIKRMHKARKPEFKRYDWYRKKRIPSSWRRPRGSQSKLRRHSRAKSHLVRVGYRSPREVRGLHPSGFVEVLVHTTSELDALEPDINAVVIGSSVGMKKHISIEQAAKELGLKVLNPTAERKGLLDAIPLPKIGPSLLKIGDSTDENSEDKPSEGVKGDD